MIVIDLRKIDDLEQDVEAALIVHLSWTDPRLAADVENTRTFEVGEIWSPRYQISNEVFARERFRDVMQVKPDGTVVHVQRFSGKFTSRLDLRRFPFDTQKLSFRLTFPDFMPDQLEPVPNTSLTGILPDLTIPDWSISGGTFKTDPIQVFDATRASMVFEFEAKRRTGYYIWKVIVPLVLIVFMSWTVFWISAENIGAQIGVATSSILTLIAYRFILGNLLPRVSYLTQLDYFILGATVLVFLALLEVVVSSALAQRGNKEQAHRVDVAARLLFPLTFALLVPAVFGVNI
ncbi:hypothetical protein [Thiogranum longum]